METVDAVVVGAGVVGLAVARDLAGSGREVLIMERAADFGTETSSRNSEVIHAGLYYPAGSLKARLCVRGKEMLYAYARQKGIACRRLGKVLVAVDSGQVAALEALRLRASGNGVDDLEWLESAELARLEPEVCGVAGMFSPSSGIIDSHGLMLGLLGDAEAAGATLVTRTPVTWVAAEDSGLVVRTGGDSPLEIRSRILVNAAGLHAQALARSTAGLDPALVPPCHYLKGYYFGLRGCRNPFRHLVYPLPDAHGLGIHATLDLAGQCRFGPDASDWVETIDYRFGAGREAAFYTAIRRYWPGLPDGALAPDYCGIRPKLHGPGAAACDFVIQGPAEHGIDGLVNLFGIESPGLTAVLALAEEVLTRLEG